MTPSTGSPIACELSLEGIVSKRADAPYASGNRGLWLKVKCLNREEFVVVRWTDPEGRRPLLGASFVIIGPFGRFRLWQRGRSAMVMEDVVASIDRRDALCAGTLRVG
jgi:hypothetical protein